MQGLLWMCLLLGLLAGPVRAEAVHEAAEEGRLEQVQAAVAEDPGCLERPDGKGYLPLHLAARNGHEPVAEFLLGQGADPNARTATGWTPLHEACAYGQAGIVRLLLSRGARVDARESQNGGTPLHVAAFNGHVEVVRLLLAARAPVNARDKDGWTALSQARDQGHARVFELLKNHGGTR